jgi:hypothetical protein
MSMCKDTIFQSMALFTCSKCNQNERQCCYTKGYRENAGHYHNHTSPHLHDVPCSGDSVSKKTSRMTRNHSGSKTHSNFNVVVIIN